MPIYAYRCTNCGHAQDVLQKISDPVLTVCPACGQPTYAKQVTAAGFQLKGSGWYVTDFRGDGKKKGGGKGDEGDAAEKKGDGAPAEADGKKGDAAAKPAGDAAPSAPAARSDTAPPAGAAPAPAAKAAAPSPPPSASGGTAKGGD